METQPQTPSKAVLKARRQEIRRDRATVHAEVHTLRHSQSTAKQKCHARKTICATVLRTTGLRADANSVKAVSELTSALLGDGNVGLFGIEDAAKMAASRIDVPAADVDDILRRPEILKRLDNLV